MINAAKSFLLVLFFVVCSPLLRGLTPTDLFIIAFLLQGNCRGVYCNYEELLELILLVYVYKNLYLVLVFSRLLGFIPFSYQRFIADEWVGRCGHLTPLLAVCCVCPCTSS